MLVNPSGKRAALACEGDIRPAKIVRNNAGGVGTFEVDDMTRLRRFLILGSEGGTYYASQRHLSVENASAVARLLEGGRGIEVVREAIATAVAGRAPKQGPTLFVLAMASRLGDAPTRSLVHRQLGSVCRTPTMLFEFIGLSKAMGEGTGWGRGLRRSVAGIYGSRTPAELAYWCTKYRSREGWTHRDVLRLAHAKPGSDGHQLVMSYICNDAIPELKADADAAAESAESAAARAFLVAVEAARRSADPAAVVELIAQHRLAREHVPSQLLNSVEIWAALLATMPMTAMLRNLAKMTAIGLLKPLSVAVRTICERLGDPAALRKARIHPFSVLLALKTYERGRGVKGSLTWEPVPALVAALDGAFYAAFGHVVPTGKRFVLGLDVSGSMDCGDICGAPGITPRVAAAAMCMATLRTEPAAHPLAFTDRLVPLEINSRMSLTEVLDATGRLSFGPTDCAAPMLWALDNKIEADVFVVFTDCETWAGEVTPAQALRRYRDATGIQAQLAVVAMTSGGFTLADPEDAGMLDIVGFDAAAPQILRDFALGTHTLGAALDDLKL